MWTEERQVYVNTDGAQFFIECRDSTRGREVASYSPFLVHSQGGAIQDFGAIAGAVFGLTSFMQAIGIGGVSALGSALFQINPFMTAVQCFGPRILDGICIGFIYRAVHKKANTYVSCAVTGFFSAFLNTLFFMTALIVMFGNTELIRNLMGGHNIIVGCCLMVGVNAISEMVSSTIITAAVGTALSKAHLIPAVQIVKTDTAA